MTEDSTGQAVLSWDFYLSALHWKWKMYSFQMLRLHVRYFFQLTFWVVKKHSQPAYNHDLDSWPCTIKEANCASLYESHQKHMWAEWVIVDFQSKGFVLKNIHFYQSFIEGEENVILLKSPLQITNCKWIFYIKNKLFQRTGPKILSPAERWYLKKEAGTWKMTNLHVCCM